MNDLASVDIYHPWKLLQRKEFAEALAAFRRHYASEKPPGRRRGLGEALLWAGEYQSAADHFSDAIARDQQTGSRWSSEEDFALLGAAEWCLGGQAAAVKTWQLGTKAPGSIGGCRTHSPLLLLLASILRPELVPRARAEKSLLQRLHSARTKAWPGTLAWYALGLIDEKALEASLLFFPPRNVRLVGLDGDWTREFYKATREFGSNNITEDDFRNRIRPMVEGSRYESGTVEDFYSIASLPEYYIARHEAADAPK